MPSTGSLQFDEGLHAQFSHLETERDPSLGPLLLIFLPHCPRPKPNKNTRVLKNSLSHGQAQRAFCQACPLTTISIGFICTKARLLLVCGMKPSNPVCNVLCGP